MGRYVIANDSLRVEADSHGAQLVSISGKGREYLWQRDPEIWEDSAPNLFPYIARLTDGTCTVNGEPYHMQIHGIAMYREFVLTYQDSSRMTFVLQADEETKKQYPWNFSFAVSYVLEGAKLSVEYRVSNGDGHEMYFAVGGHPGFAIPEEEGIPFDAYVLEFSGEKNCPEQPVKRIGFTPTCFVSGIEPEYPLPEKRIRLSHDLFDDDAIVLHNAPRSVTLHAEGSERAVRVSYPQMDYIGFWHKVRYPAPYICIEPWSSLPSRDGIIEELSEQPGLICLEPGGVYKNTWTIEIL